MTGETGKVAPFPWRAKEQRKPGLDKFAWAGIILPIRYAKRREEVSFAKRAFSEGEQVQAPGQRQKAAASEQSAKSGTAHLRYRVA